jgi:hypothetical protein
VEQPAWVAPQTLQITITAENIPPKMKIIIKLETFNTR